MERLKAARLFGDGLVPISSPALVDRYNTMLQALGITPTALTSFSIDGLGWSPEVASEKDDYSYLSAGPANPMGVILTPEQMGKPLYFPYNSYDRRMLAAWHDRYSQQVVHVTTTQAIGLNIDQELTHYVSPLDLMLVDYIIVRAEVGEITRHAKEQKRTEIRLRDEPMAWLNDELRQQFLSSVNNHGDLRNRLVNIPEFRYELGSFHTEAFGGVFVFRPKSAKRRKRQDLVVVEQQDHCQRHEGTYWLGDPDLFDRLVQDGTLIVDLDWHVRHPEVVEVKKQGLVIDAILEREPDIEIASLSAPQWKRKIAAMHESIPDSFHEIERALKRVQKGLEVAGDSLSREAQLMLARPNRTLPAAESEVLWSLLSRLCRCDVVRLYASDKNRFFAAYSAWPVAKRDWAIKAIQGGRIVHQQPIRLRKRRK